MNTLKIYHDRKNTPTLAEAKEYIYSMDFSMIIDKMVSQGWPRSVVQNLSFIYRNFLYLNRKYLNTKKKLPPSEEIDEFWHNHILDTSKYRIDCQNIFGFYFDHYPYFGMDNTSNLVDLASAFYETQELYLEEFGVELPKVTNRFSHMGILVRKIIKSFN